MNKQTEWNKKLMQYSGEYVTCDKFEKDGLSTEGYIINPDGSLGFRNQLRSLNMSSELFKGTFKNYWDTKQKARFLNAVLKTK